MRPSSLLDVLPTATTLLDALRVGPPDIPTGDVRWAPDELPSRRTLLKAYPEWEGSGATRAAGAVRRVAAAELSYDDFFRHHLCANEPVHVDGVATHWRASREWTRASIATTSYPAPPAPEPREPDVDFLATHFDSPVQVADCARDEGAERRTMRLVQYAEYWRTRAAPRAAAGDGEAAVETGEAADALYYLKDWHHVAQFPSYGAYDTPPWFRDDWLNWAHDATARERVADAADDATDTATEPAVQCADYRFVYLGPAGSFTALHSDVLRSYSWSVNVCGWKRWRLWPPEETPLLLDRHGNHMPQTTGAAEAAQYPSLANAFCVEVLQGPGEGLFVPSGWHHQVHNVADTLSVNHNWINACNVHWTYQLLRRDLADATAAIEDCKHICDDFDALCQRNLKMNSSMDMADFFHFLRRVAAAELAALPSMSPSQPHRTAADAPTRTPAQQLPPRTLLVMFGLQRIVAVLRCMQQHQVCADEEEGLQTLIARIQTALDQWLEKPEKESKPCTRTDFP